MHKYTQKEEKMFTQLTKEQAREILLTEIWDDIEYWENIDVSTCREKLQGLAFSILTTLDGRSANAPGFAVIPMNGTENISGSLHEVFYSYRPE